jgi:two-component system chemotaxis response regulator CheB
MGADGASGLGALRRVGAHTIAQDRATSIVWGMPGAAVAAGAAATVLPIDRIGPALLAGHGQASLTSSRGRAT